MHGSESFLPSITYATQELLHVGTATIEDQSMEFHRCARRLCCMRACALADPAGPRLTRAAWCCLDHFREPTVGGDPENPWTSLPGWFLEHGYYVHGMGKLYHPGLPPNNDGAENTIIRTSNEKGHLPRQARDKRQENSTKNRSRRRSVVERPRTVLARRRDSAPARFHRSAG
jgi:hypothetical protein